MKHDWAEADPPIAPTLTQAFEDTAQLVPDRGVGIYDRRGLQCEFRTYPQWLQSARLNAARLAALGLRPGDRVLMCLPTSWDLLDLHLGAILLGARPVLLAPPGTLGGAQAHARKAEALMELLAARRFICDQNARKEVQDFGARTAAAASLLPAEIAAATPQASQPLHRPDPGDLAFLQPTSGSTGRQRAVMIRHANVIHNTQAICRLMGGRAGGPDSVASWLPLNHDMGLVGCVLFALTHRFNLWLLRPDSFLARPHLWLQILSRHGCAASPAPNFAYQLCVERTEMDHLTDVDVSRWRVALTGAEMVQPETCRAFCDKFKSIGFRPPQFVPSYGMAETTLAVSGDMARLGVRTASVPGTAVGMPREVVCTGTPVLDTQIRIAAPGASGSFLPEGQVGEVCIQGPGVFAGYYGDREATEKALRDGWLRTGDLGFLKAGELYLTGRLKDLLIIHGHNLMPHELEWVAEGVTGGGSERCGAFSVSRGAEGEGAVLVVEVGERDGADLAQLGREIRVRIGQTLGLPLTDLLFVKRGQLPKTTSGKVQRGELRERYLQGRVERLGG